MKKGLVWGTNREDRAGIEGKNQDLNRNSGPILGSLYEFILTDWLVLFLCTFNKLDSFSNWEIWEIVRTEWGIGYDIDTSYVDAAYSSTGWHRGENRRYSNDLCKSIAHFPYLTIVVANDSSVVQLFILAAGTMCSEWGIGSHWHLFSRCCIQLNRVDMEGENGKWYV